MNEYKIDSMQLFVICLLLITLCFQSNSQGFQLEWTRSIPGNSTERIHKLVTDDHNGNVYAIGYFRDSISQLSTSQTDETFIACYREDGHLNWIKSMNTSGPNQGYGIAYDSDGFIYVSGAFNATIQSQQNQITSSNLLDAFLAKLDTSGSTIWVQHVGGVGFEYGYDIDLDHDGNVYMAGSFEDTLVVENTTIIGGGLKDAFTAKFDKNGQFQWIKTWGGPAFVAANSIDINSENEIVVGGIFRDIMIIDNDTLISNGNIDGYMLRMSTDGSIIWSKYFGGNMLDELKDVVIDPFGNSYATGWFDKSITVDGQSTTGSKEEDGFLLKFYPSGQLAWIQSIDGTFDERAYTLSVDSNLNVFVGGTVDSLLVLQGDTLTNRHLNRPTNLFVIQYDSSGQYISSCSLGYYYNDYVFDLNLTPNGDIYLCGIFQDTTIFIGDSLFASADFDVFVCKLINDAQVSVTKIADEKGSKPLIFPNPAKHILHLRFDQPQIEPVFFKIHHIDGRCASEGQITFSGDFVGKVSTQELSIGTYVIQVQTMKNQYALLFKISD